MLERSCGPGEQVWGLYDEEELWIRAVTAGNPAHVKRLVIMTRDEVTKTYRRIEKPS